MRSIGVGLKPGQRAHNGWTELRAAHGLRGEGPARRRAFLTERLMSDRKGARILFKALPPAKVLIADKALTTRIPPSGSRRRPYPNDRSFCRQRHGIENLVAELKDWGRIATRYNRCAHTVLSAICIAATIAFRL